MTHSRDCLHDHVRGRSLSHHVKEDCTASMPSVRSEVVHKQFRKGLCQRLRCCHRATCIQVSGRGRSEMLLWTMYSRLDNTDVVNGLRGSAVHRGHAAAKVSMLKF